MEYASKPFLSAAYLPAVDGQRIQVDRRRSLCLLALQSHDVVCTVVNWLSSLVGNLPHFSSPR